MTAAPTLRKVAVALFDGFTALDVYDSVGESVARSTQTLVAAGNINT
jgi:hypothetical protein